MNDQWTGREWILHPLDGATGQAFMGTYNEEKIFLKRNSSPFLTAVAMEGITPRLIWTQRVANGDTYSAQEWMNGRILTRDEMCTAMVTQLIHRYQNSPYLLRMLEKVDGEEWQAERFLDDLLANSPAAFRETRYVREIIQTLKDTAPTLNHEALTVCHGDLNRRNFLLGENGRLYLVDWEMVKLADPLYDISQLFVQYIPDETHEEWLSAYGMMLDSEEQKHLQWYKLFHLLRVASESYQRDNHYTYNHCIYLAQQVMHAAAL